MSQGWLLQQLKNINKDIGSVHLVSFPSILSVIISSPHVCKMAAAAPAIRLSHAHVQKQRKDISSEEQRTLPQMFPVSLPLMFYLLEQITGYSGYLKLHKKPLQNLVTNNHNPFVLITNLHLG